MPDDNASGRVTKMLMSKKYKPYTDAHARQIVALIGQFNLSNDKEVEECIALVVGKLQDVKLDFFDTVIELIFKRYGVNNVQVLHLPILEQGKALGAGNVITDVYSAVYPEK